MVDYYTPAPHPTSANYYYALPGYRDESFIFQPPPDDSPLNLCLNQDRSPAPAASMAVGLVAAPEPPVGELGNMFIVSDLECAIAQEEIVEAEVKQEEPEESGEEDLDEEQDEEEELAQEYSRNIALKSKYEELSTKVAKIREILDMEARKERTETVFTPNMETEVEVKSEGELDYGEVSTVPPLKRCRNHSWPQMSTINSNQRKKEQNKMASKRFRERKKMELARAKSDISELEARNSRLRSRVDSMQYKADNLKKILLQLRLIKIVDLPSGQSTIVKI